MIAKVFWKPQGFTEGKRRVYTEQQRQTLELILLLKRFRLCVKRYIDMLLKGEGTFEDTQYLTNYETTRN